MANVWNFRQRFSFRVSTILLLLALCLMGIGAAETLMPAPLALWIMGALGIIGIGGLLIAFLLVAIFSLAFFLNSLYHRTPQVQYVVEFAIGAAALLYMPVY